MGEFPVVTVCGSMRFYKSMLEFANDATARGEIVILPHVVKGDGIDGEMLDRMHREKIRMADRVVVVTDMSSYVGDSTKAEMAYCREIGKDISFYIW